MCRICGSINTDMVIMKSILWLDDNPEKLMNIISLSGHRFWEHEIRLEFFLIGNAFNENNKMYSMECRKQDFISAVIEEFRNFCIDKCIDDNNSDLEGCFDKYKELICDQKSNPNFVIGDISDSTKENEILDTIRSISRDKIVMLDLELFWGDFDSNVETGSTLSSKIYRLKSEEITIYPYTTHANNQFFIRKWLEASDDNIEIISRTDLNNPKSEIIEKLIKECNNDN